MVGGKQHQTSLLDSRRQYQPYWNVPSKTIVGHASYMCRLVPLQHVQMWPGSTTCLRVCRWGRNRRPYALECPKHWLPSPNGTYYLAALDEETQTKYPMHTPMSNLAEWYVKRSTQTARDEQPARETRNAFLRILVTWFLTIHFSHLIHRY